MESYQKEVNISRLAGSAAPVVVKALQNAGAFAFGHRESDIAYFELLWLEYLRGEPGVPALYGGWMTSEHLVWVVSHGGPLIGTIRDPRVNHNRKKPPSMLSAYDEMAREDPLHLARSWLRCFRSFGERGGFVLTDFKVNQFTLGRDGEIYLVDGPAPNSGPVAAERELVDLEVRQHEAAALGEAPEAAQPGPVSYTHLTLPTILLV